MNLLKNKRIVEVPARETEFVAREHFNTSNGKGIFSQIGQNFEDWFLSGSGIVEPPFPGSRFYCYQLSKGAEDIPRKKGDIAIIPELGGETVVKLSLYEIYVQMNSVRDSGMQSLKDQVRLIDTCCIFYAVDLNGILRDVCGIWHGNGWMIQSMPLARTDSSKGHRWQTKLNTYHYVCSHGSV
jgi:hypothetical protein